MLVLVAGKTCTSFYTYLDIVYIDYLLLLLLELSLCFSVLFFLLATIIIVVILKTTTSFSAADFEVYLNKAWRMTTKTNARVLVVLFSYWSLLLLYIIVVVAAADTNILLLLLYCWVGDDVVCV